jgi:MerR family mercuric resistance operon transcriptional regulator
MSRLRIGQVAQAAGVNIETIRYYERCGLLSDPGRRESGYRAYPPDTVARVQFIKRAQQLGFTLREIAGLLALRVDAETTCDQVREQAEAKLAEIDARIADMQQIRGALATLSAACADGGPAGECPLLDALRTDSEPEAEQSKAVQFKSVE